MSAVSCCALKQGRLFLGMRTLWGSETLPTLTKSHRITGLGSSGAQASWWPVWGLWSWHFSLNWSPDGFPSKPSLKIKPHLFSEANAHCGCFPNSRTCRSALLAWHKLPESKQRSDMLLVFDRRSWSPARRPRKGCLLYSFPFSQRACKTPGCPSPCVTVSLAEL